MIKSQEDLIRKVHLLISVFIVVPVALIYGFNPDLKFDLHPKTIDELNLFKAIMGIYLGFSILWILGIIKSNLWRTAVISNIIFMLSLGFGRLFSILLDGTPTVGYTFGTAAELLLGFYGVWLLNRK